MVSIDTLRALVTATNSLRYNPEIDPDVAVAYEWALVNLRDELSQEMDNPPLTLEELREMDGEPVWVTSPDNRFEPCWMLVMIRRDFVMANWRVCDFNAYGKTWLAYCRKPEEDQ